MTNYPDQEKARRFFWESTLYAPMILPTWLPPEQIKQQFPIAFAQHEDTLSLKLDGDSEKTVHMHTAAWMRSLDYLLYRYLTLVLHDSHYSSTIRVPVEVRQKYQEYRIPSKKRQRKDYEFILPDYYIEPHDGTLDSNDSDGKYEYFKTVNPVAPAILNVFCHGLFPQAGDHKTRWNPHINAQLYELGSCGENTIPDFRPEDYIAYELMTGLSLSVEITAVLLEIDEEIRNLALYYFCKYAIKDLVRSPFLYARSTAAHNFFLQINMEWKNNKYEWTPSSTREPMEYTIDRAASNALPCIQMLSTNHLGPEQSMPIPYGLVEGPDLKTVLQQMEHDSDNCHVVEWLRKAEKDPTYGEKYRITPCGSKPGEFQIEVFAIPRYPISFPRTDDLAEMESYKKQILENLKVVTSPLDWETLFKPKPKNLAVFTNSNHRFVSMLMDYVKTGHLQTRSRKDPPPIKSQDCINLFRLVFPLIRYHSIEAHQDIYQVKRFLTQMQPPSA